MKPGIYLVATPIGNLKDITIRALETLQNVDLIASEDTRVTKILLTHYNISKELIVFNDHSNFKKIIDLAKTKAIAICSDAGTPNIADPGFLLVHHAFKEGIYVDSMPGPCAIINALCASPIKSLNFCFLNFAPRSYEHKIKILKKHKFFEGAIVFYESPNRINDLLLAIHEVFPNRYINVVREMTKTFQESIYGYAKDINVINKGEFVVIIEGFNKEQPEDNIEELIVELISKNKNMSSKDLKEYIYNQLIDYDLSKKMIYDIIVKQQ
jgi:16S rRNA (cytidine1402-2'-O)-methyltransferase